MKKIITFILLACMVFSFAACADHGSTMPENTAPVITLQEVYEAGKDYTALLGDHENAHILTTSNGEVLIEVYLTQDYFYSFYDAKYVNLGVDFTDFTTDHSLYSYFNGGYSRTVILAQSGLIDQQEYFDMARTGSFISSMMSEDTSVITEKDGSIIVTSVSDEKDIGAMGEGVVSCEEIYTLDAKTREMTSVKTVFTHEDGTIEEINAAITRDVEMPEGMKVFCAYEQETENLRTITIVSNPGTENEKTEIIKSPKGLIVSFTPDIRNTDKLFTAYSDAACTQPISGSADPNSNVTVYVKWDE